MKIAVPSTRQNTIDAHFGHCEFYQIFTISDDNKIIKSEVLESPQGCGCKSNIALTLAQINVSIMLAGGIGAGAINVINSAGIKVIRGCSGDIKDAVNNYISGNLSDGGSNCNHHNGDHECSH